MSLFDFKNFDLWKHSKNMSLFDFKNSDRWKHSKNMSLFDFKNSDRWKHSKNMSLFDFKNSDRWKHSKNMPLFDFKNFDRWKILTLKSSNLKTCDWVFLDDFEYIFFVITFEKTCVRFFRNQIVFEILNVID